MPARGITVHYETRGAGHPVILLHGGGPDHRSLLGCMEPVFQANHGWQRLYPDLPGLGRTRGEAWITSSDQMLEVVQGFIQATIPGRHFALVGESYGAYLARGIVYREPALVDGLMSRRDCSAPWPGSGWIACGRAWPRRRAELAWG